MELINKIIAFFKSKKGKQIAFFSFYFVFFIFLGFYINDKDLIKDDNSKPEPKVKEEKNYYETKNLENSDYTYKITINVNGKADILNGTRANNQSIKEYEYANIIDLAEVKRVIKNAKFLEKTAYNEETYQVNYEIKTKDLAKLFDYEINLETLNSIMLIVKENSDLVKIELDFSNYMQIVDNKINLYKVLIEYEY